jgi:hypothetical protein
MAQIKHRQRLSEYDKLHIIDDIATQVIGWSDKELTIKELSIKYVGFGTFEFYEPDNDPDDPSEMVAHQCSCGSLFADWHEASELANCPGCGAYISECLMD